MALENTIKSSIAHPHWTKKRVDRWRFINQDESLASPREKINKPTLQLILTRKESACEWCFSQVHRVWTTLIIYNANCFYCLLDNSLIPSILLPLLFTHFLSILLSPHPCSLFLKSQREVSENGLPITQSFPLKIFNESFTFNESSQDPN